MGRLCLWIVPLALKITIRYVLIFQKISGHRDGIIIFQRLGAIVAAVQ